MPFIIFLLRKTVFFLNSVIVDQRSIDISQKNYKKRRQRQYRNNDRRNMYYFGFKHLLFWIYIFAAVSCEVRNDVNVFVNIWGLNIFFFPWLHLVQNASWGYCIVMTYDRSKGVFKYKIHDMRWVIFWWGIQNTYIHMTHINTYMYYIVWCDKNGECYLFPYVFLSFIIASLLLILVIIIWVNLNFWMRWSCVSCVSCDEQ